MISEQGGQMSRGVNESGAGELLPEGLPEVGELVQVRSRRWLVEDVAGDGDGAVVHLACADDDNQGARLEVFWEFEPDRRILRTEDWKKLAGKGFDAPSTFAAFLHTLRWNCVTATNPELFQSPFRAGIRIDAYQMEPLRKALQLPRVNVFIADDTGLGKTIEAGLIAQELLLRRKAKSVVVAAPPSMLEQWRAELEERFGLLFMILDRATFSRIRRERSFAVNPWLTHSRFLISHKLLIDPTYAEPMRAWLGSFLPGSLLILDEAHHAAPASGGHYGIETQFTRAIRDISSRFEHRIFLSATPHNGHSESFATLMEILDPYRFTRGVKIAEKSLEPVMVRRLKEDVRAIQGGFPIRHVQAIPIENLPLDAPELELSRLLNTYRAVREKRFAKGTRRAVANGALMVIGLQQRLLSSIEAFARTLKVHRETTERRWKATQAALPPAHESTDRQASFLTLPDADDERASLDDETAEHEESRLVEALTLEEDAASTLDTESRALFAEEQELLARMSAIAEAHRHRPDPKLTYIIDWIREHLCPDLPPLGRAANGPPARWLNRRVLIFTENRQGTKAYLKRLLEHAIESTDGADHRIAVIDGLTQGERRREIQRRFNTDPRREPLRILIATDAAREGLNFQAHCADLFHFDLPWNPGRIEQRNGRIDRKLQPAAEVFCRYFTLTQRVEDRVLEVLVRKTDTIKRELGSLSQVLDAQIVDAFQSGIRHEDADALVRNLQSVAVDNKRLQVVDAELEAVRDRQDQLRAQVDRCRTLLDQSRKWVRFEEGPFRNALSCALELANLPPLKEGKDESGRTIFHFPTMAQSIATDPSWSATLDSLRTPRKSDQKITDWRKEAPIRPVVFQDTGVLSDDTVHLHLEQRVAQRLLSRFRSQGFIHHDLSRACLAQTKDAIPRVVLLGRLALYGTGAERLHEEIIPITARWLDPSKRKGPLQPYAKDAERKTLDLVDRSLDASTARFPDPVIQAMLLAAAPGDIDDLLPALKPRAEDCAAEACQALHQRGEKEAKDLRDILLRQRTLISKQLEAYERQQTSGVQGKLWPDEERDQRNSDAKSWRARLATFDHDLEEAPARVSAFYEVKAQRIEPIGLIYLWPESN